MMPLVSGIHERFPSCWEDMVIRFNSCVHRGHPESNEKNDDSRPSDSIGILDVVSGGIHA